MRESILVDENRMERKQHGTPSFPFAISHVRLSDYDGWRFDCHWHKEVEFIFVQEGCMRLQVNEAEYTVEAGEAVYINTGALHMGWPVDGGDCRYWGITLSPSLLGQEGGCVKSRYVDPVLDCIGFSGCPILPEEDWGRALLGEICEMDALYRGGPKCAEIRIQAQILRIWALLYPHVEPLLTSGAGKGEVTAMKGMLSFLHANYGEKITLGDIARAASISESTCSHLFKAYMRESPFQYLLRYRVERSLPLLAEAEQTITQVAQSVGFAHASYYTEIFRRYKGMTPRAYRAAARQAG